MPPLVRDVSVAEARARWGVGSHPGITFNGRARGGNHPGHHSAFGHACPGYPWPPLPLGEAIIAILGFACAFPDSSQATYMALQAHSVATMSAPWPLRLHVRVPTSVLLVSKCLRGPVVT